MAGPDFQISTTTNHENLLHAKGIQEWVENKSENPAVNYSRHPLASISQREKVMTRVDKTLEKITDPILVLQDDTDPACPVRLRPAL